MRKVSDLLTPEMEQELADALPLLDLGASTHFVISKPNPAIDLLAILPVRLDSPGQQVMWSEGYSESSRGDH